MLVGTVSGSDKTMVSVMTGHQEYHPVYLGLANILNSIHHARRNSGILPVAILPIPKGKNDPF